MINKEELLNQIYRLKRYKEPSLFNFLPEFETIPLDAIVSKIEELGAEDADEEIDFEEVVYNAVHKMASAKRGMDKALEELTEDEKAFILQMLRLKQEEVESDETI